MSAAAITFSPDPAELDDDVEIALSGLRPGSVTARASAVDELGRRWTSWAQFGVTGEGTLDVPAQVPTAGIYRDIDGSGLFWSMRSDRESDGPSLFVKQTMEPLPIRFVAEQQGSVVAEATLVRRVLHQGVVRTEIREDGLAGVLFEPAGVSPRGAVISMNGSGGGLHESRAAVLARHGYVSFALAYFGYADLPAELREIPLEYFGRAITWLQARPGVDPRKIAVLGVSRGGELALLLGSTFSAITAVIAVVPANVAFGGTGANASVSNGAAWTLGGAPIPFVGGSARDLAPSVPGQPLALTPGYLALLSDKDAVERAAIRVEKINGPVLLVSASDDQVWPSTLMSNMVLERLERYRHPYPVRHFVAPGASHHRLDPPYLPVPFSPGVHPVTHTYLTFGGNPIANARAHIDSWREVRMFLAASFG